MINLKRKKEKSKKGNKAEICCAEPREMYPWGTRLDFREEEVSKIPMLQNVTVGQELTMTAKVRVTEMGDRQEMVDGKPKQIRTREIQVLEVDFKGDAQADEDEGFKKAAGK